MSLNIPHRLTVIPTPARVGATKATENKHADSGTVRRQRQRIITALHSGLSEKAIAESESIPESEVRRVRTVELARIDRALAGVKVCLNNTIELAKQDEADYWDEVAA